MEIGHTLYTSMRNINERVVAFGVVEFIKEHINRGSPRSRVIWSQIPLASGYSFKSSNQQESCRPLNWSICWDLSDMLRWLKFHVLILWLGNLMKSTDTPVSLTPLIRSTVAIRGSDGNDFSCRRSAHTQFFSNLYQLHWLPSKKGQWSDGKRSAKTSWYLVKNPSAWCPLLDQKKPICWSFKGAHLWGEAQGNLFVLLHQGKSENLRGVNLHGRMRCLPVFLKDMIKRM